MTCSTKDFKPSLNLFTVVASIVGAFETYGITVQSRRKALTMPYTRTVKISATPRFCLL
jgi:hypothetical protein